MNRDTVTEKLYTLSMGDAVHRYDYNFKGGTR